MNTSIVMRFCWLLTQCYYEETINVELVDGSDIWLISENGQSIGFNVDESKVVLYIDNGAGDSLEVDITNKKLTFNLISQFWIFISKRVTPDITKIRMLLGVNNYQKPKLNKVVG